MLDQSDTLSVHDMVVGILLIKIADRVEITVDHPGKGAGKNDNRRAVVF
jgi:hypothetical protein